MKKIDLECESKDAKSRAVEAKRQSHPGREREESLEASTAAPSPAGNLAVQRMLRSNLGSAELNVSNPEDEHEIEASKLADDVISATGASVEIPVTEPEEHHETHTHPVTLPTGDGRPLDGATRSFMESKFGRDFEDVRIHTGPETSELARTLRARAFTTGNDIVFGEGEHAPDTSEGRKLIAHELAHVVQRRKGISRQPATHPPPQTPAAQTPAQATQAAPAPPACTAQKTARQALADHNVRAETLFRMERAINMAAQRTPTKFSASLLSRADAAIQAEYGSYITRTPTYAQAFAKPTKDASVTAMAPDAFAKMRVPDEAAARTLIGELAMRSAPEAMSEACITSASDAAIVSDVADPILKAKGLSFVQDYVKSAEGGRTTFSDPDAAKSEVKAVFQTEVSNLGHIMVHEAMHYYMSDVFRVEARKRTDHLDLVEGGAEFFARNVISNQLAGDPDFSVHDLTYARHVNYIAGFSVAQHLWFPAIFFQGRTDLLAQIVPPSP